MSREIPFYQVDAFASAPFKGNQAAVMLLEDGFLADDTLQFIATENNVGETAFLVPDGESAWLLRWHTPAVEVPLCGHATLAAAHILFNDGGFQGDEITFRTRMSGELRVKRAPGGYVMDFPAAKIAETTVTDEIAEALGARPIRAWAGPYGAVQFETPEEIVALSPDFPKIGALDFEPAHLNYMPGTLAAFAFGERSGAEVTSRFFGPSAGLNEDPATGSWHCMLAVIAESLTGKDTMRCFQAHPGRGADITTHLNGERVFLTGQAFTVIRGIFTVPD